ncbi:MAG TPA: hypothetical protein VMX13_06710 [Sedimentisphaerales bacterium]|nr:hypothetical protein [Sedimentisphaerales bacterium]
MTDAKNVEAGLLFAVEVIPVVEVFPASVVIAGFEAAKGWLRRLTFKFNGQVDKNLEYGWTNELFADAIEVQNSIDQNGERVVVLSPKCGAAVKSLLGRWSDLVFSFRPGVDCGARVYVGNRAFIHSEEFVEERKEARMGGS